MFEKNENATKTWQWDDDIDKDEWDKIDKERNYAKFSEGLQKFTFTDYTIEHYKGSQKIPECERVKLVLQFDLPDGKTVKIYDYLPQCSVMMWKTENFFKAFLHGYDKAQQSANVNSALDKVIGSRGEAYLLVNTYERDDGVTVINNVVKNYLPYVRQR